MLKKVWYIVCVLFSIYSILLLYEDGYALTYASINKTESIYYLNCFGLKETSIYSNKTKIDLNQLNKDLVNYFHRLMKDHNLTEFENSILRQIEIKGYIIYKNFICFNFNQSNFLLKTSLFKKAKLLAYNNDTFDFFKLKNFEFFVDQLIVLNRAYPYTNCIENYSKFKCLNRCFKAKYRY